MLLLDIPTNAQSYFHSVYPSVWNRSGAYTLEVAESMPEDKYNYKPDEGIMTFQEQMIHIAQNLSFLSGKIDGINPDFHVVMENQALNKQEVIEILLKSIEHVAHLIQDTQESTLDEEIIFGGEKMTKENIFYLMRDHMAHHRGQAILYLRTNGIDAPAYRGW